MMASGYMPRTREYRGIQPNSVAIRARNPLKKPADWFIRKNREVGERLHEMEIQVQEQKLRDIRTDFETSGERRILITNVKSHVKTLMDANECTLECRREKLQNMLANEEACYMKEIEEQKETVLERQAKMRERAKFLKDKRESERLAFAQQKYDQQFREQCEELRSALSKKHYEEICLDRLDQLQQKEEAALERQAYDDMYARLWEQDMLEKAAREEREVKELHERNRGTLEIQRKQMAALEAQRQEEKKLKEEEAQIMKEQQALWKLEDEMKKKEKIQKQNETRVMLERTLAAKARKKAKEEQEQLAFDVKMLEQLLHESHHETVEAMERKRELREEDRRYREYLRKLLEEENARQKELDKFIQQEVDAAWEKRMEQWRKEKMARKLLMNEVMEGRAKQLKERLQENERLQAEAAREREQLLYQMEENRRCEAEENARRLETGLKHQRDLVDQISWNTRARDEERELEKDELKKAQQTELEFQARKQHVLSNPLIEKIHPMRRAILAQTQRC
ncbi:unnamed protein product [Candidula unifasciata]|uniref:Cilia- and flagella-associated protein 53 n=1 Tax=Candidula unifasciata TaxID=100452 RepID=A0A8S3ZU34_9EUPU|nr:unnamed protein product [Candidula unifasciata]